MACFFIISFREDAYFKEIPSSRKEYLLQQPLVLSNTPYRLIGNDIDGDVLTAASKNFDCLMQDRKQCIQLHRQSFHDFKSIVDKEENMIVVSNVYCLLDLDEE